VHVIVAFAKQDVEDRREDPWLVPAEVVARDKIERGPSFGLDVVVPLGPVFAPAYDPRPYMTLAENAMAARVMQAAKELRSAGTTMMQ
jgi:fructose/tagatose bisphosphate aldolase